MATDLLFVGRLVEKKGVATLVESLALLKEEFPGLKLTCVGDGPERHVIEQRARELQVSNMISFRGAVPNHEIPGFYQVTRIAVSKHLHVLRDSHLVQMVDSADARERHYALNAAGLGEVRAWLQRYDTFWQQHLKTLKHLAEAKPTDSQ